MKKLILLLLLPLLFLIKPISAHAETQIPERPVNGIYDPKIILPIKYHQDYQNLIQHLIHKLLYTLLIL